MNDVAWAEAGAAVLLWLWYALVVLDYFTRAGLVLYLGLRDPGPGSFTQWTRTWTRRRAVTVNAGLVVLFWGLVAAWLLVPLAGAVLTAVTELAAPVVIWPLCKRAREKFPYEGWL